MLYERLNDLVRLGIATAAVGLMTILYPAQILAEPGAPQRIVMFTTESVKSPDLQEAGVVDRTNTRMREIVRQAVLLAAREECGLATRDETLGEPVNRDGQDCITVSVALDTETSLALRLSKNGQEFYSTSIPMEFDLKLPIVRPTAYLSLAEHMEQLSRTEIADALEKAGYPRRSRSSGDSTTLPQEIVQLLGKMNPISQYAALRQLHRMNSVSPDSPEVLGGLVRGYAHMSQLMLPALDLRFKAYGARALLYAQRYVQLQPESAEPYWYRAYALTWMGYPNAGRTDLEKATELASSDEIKPRWVDWIHSYHYFRFSELERAAKRDDSPDRETAALLWFLASRMVQSNVYRIETGKSALEISPYCQRILSGMCEVAGVRYGHRLTAMGPAMQASVIQQFLSDVDDLPVLVKFGFEGELDELSLLRPAQAVADEAVGDTGEPSWYVLSSNIRAWNAEPLFRRAHFMRFSLGIDAKDYIDAIRPVLEDDPFLPLFDSMAIPNANLAESVASLLAEVYLPDLNIASIGFDLLQSLYRYMPRDNPPASSTVSDWRARSWHDASMLEDEYLKIINQLSGNNQLNMAKWLAQASKAAPVHFTVRIVNEWERLGDKKEWFSQEYSEYPDVQRALASAYLQAGEYDKAIETLEHYLTMVQDVRGCISLAHAHYLRGDQEQWLEALNRSFECEDYALSHAKAAQIAASTLMHEGRFKEAREWAEISGQSYSLWGVDCLIECLTGLGELKNAESLAKQMYERYNSNLWYFWCLETGKGDLESAWQTLLNRLRQYYTEDQSEFVAFRMNHAWATGDHELALSMMRERFEKHRTSGSGIMLALLADRLGKTEERDSVLAQMASLPSDDPSWSYLCELAGIFQQAISSGELDTEALNASLDGMGDERSGWISVYQLYSGYFLFTRGLHDKAIHMWKIPARSSARDLNRSLAWTWLREAGVDPIQLEGRAFPQMFQSGTSATVFEYGLE